jgi:hypothetical protein
MTDERFIVKKAQKTQSVAKDAKQFKCLWEAPLPSYLPREGIFLLL